MNKLSSEVQDVTHEHSFSGAEGGYRCACGVIRPDRDDVPNAAFRRHGVQDVDRCVKCGHDAPLFDEPPLEGHCTVDIAVGNEKGGRPCGCKCEFPSTSVSEAAPERIWIQKDTSFFQATGNGTYYRDPDKNSIEYARVHQPPQKLEDKNSVSGAGDYSTDRIPKDRSLDAAVCPVTQAPHHWKGAMDIRNEVYVVALNVLCEPEMGDTPLNVLATTIADDVYKSLVAPRPTTQDGASASAHARTIPDHGQASEPESSESKSVHQPDVQVVDEVSKEQDNAKS